MAAVGIPGFSTNGKVDIYARSGVTWAQMDEIQTSTDNTGSHVELSGNKILIGAFASNSGLGKFYVFIITVHRGLKSLNHLQQQLIQLLSRVIMWSWVPDFP